MHNVVNKRLGKPEFTCNDVFDFWGGECGCNDDHHDTKKLSFCQKNKKNIKAKKFKGKK
jgi:hypothetical protein